jgi:predicted dienelactone hydrolase
MRDRIQTDTNAPSTCGQARQTPVVVMSAPIASSQQWLDSKQSNN